MAKPTTIKNSQHEVRKMATKLANQKVRELLLDMNSIQSGHQTSLEDFSNSKFAAKLVQISGKSLNTLKRSWSPFQIDMDSDMAMKLQVSDPLVRALMQDAGIYDQALDIATDSFMEALQMPQTNFIQTMLQNLFDEEPYYEIQIQ